MKEGLSAWEGVGEREFPAEEGIGKPWVSELPKCTCETSSLEHANCFACVRESKDFAGLPSSRMGRRIRAEKFFTATAIEKCSWPIPSSELLRKRGSALCDARFHSSGGVAVDGPILCGFVYGLIERRELRRSFLRAFRREKFPRFFRCIFQHYFPTCIENAPPQGYALRFFCRTRVCHNAAS